MYVVRCMHQGRQVVVSSATLDTPPHRRAHEKEGGRERENRKVHIGKDIYYNSYPRCLQKIGVQSPSQPSRTRCLVKGKKGSARTAIVWKEEGAHGSRQGSSYYSIVVTSQRRSKRPSRLAPHLGTVVFQNFAPANAMQSCESRDSCSKQPAYYRDTRDQ